MIVVAVCVSKVVQRVSSFAPRSSSSSSGPHLSTATTNTAKITDFRKTRILLSGQRRRKSSFLLRSAPPEVASSTAEEPERDYNSVFVAKEGGRGATLASQQAYDQNLSLGAPPVRPVGGHYLTKGGIQVTANVESLEYSPPAPANADSNISNNSNNSNNNNDINLATSAGAMEDLVVKLDDHKGVLLTSSYEFPGRYARWSLGFVDPPLQVSGKDRDCTITALNDRGRVLMPAIQKAMENLRDDGILESVRVSGERNAGRTTDRLSAAPDKIDVKVVPPPPVGTFSEEERSRQPSLFSVVRALVDLFAYKGDCRQAGLYGAFGYDLTFSFEPIDLKQPRDPEQRDLLLYLPDTIVVVDQDKRDAWRVSYEFCANELCTQGLPATGSIEPFRAASDDGDFESRDTPPSAFSESVERAKREFAVGNLFEAVLSQTFREKLDEQTPPSAIFRRLQARNPAPYGFFINLGEQEYLVGASPEMFVRCETTDDNDYRNGAIRVETCPISGTVARGADALEDAQRIKSLMMNAKEESELTMCTDVDRNDKSRICEPGSVQVIGRRQIEMYSRLIHTVDHVEGYLREAFDALDAFLCHTWAVTVTGAPKTWAIQFVEDNENSPRCWYGGAVGMVGFDGGLNTGLTLRTVRVKNGVAEVRAGATLLYDSNPIAEEKETELKASAMIDAITKSGPEEGKDPKASSSSSKRGSIKVGSGKSVVLIDHEDSFVHTLGNYLRQTGASVQTLRSGKSALESLERMVQEGNKPDLVVLSPGPGNPSDFGLSASIELLTRHRIPGFGVCLGLQGMVEYFGGSLGVLSYPMHGKPSMVTLTPQGKEDNSIFHGLPDTFEVARYHSLHGIKERIPSCLDVIASSDDGIVMGIQHKTLPFGAVQFHPESILTGPTNGMAILQNALVQLQYKEDAGDAPGGITGASGAELVGKLEKLSVTELKERLVSAGLSSTGSKSELVVKLALWTHKANELRTGRLLLNDMTVPELRELKQGLGLKGTAATKASLIEVLEQSLQQDS